MSLEESISGLFRGYDLMQLALAREQELQVEFLVTFRRDAHAVIIPSMKRAQKAIREGAGRHAPAVEIHGPEDRCRVELSIAFDGKSCSLVFRADPLSMTVEWSSSEEDADATALSRAPMTDEIAAPIVARFVERSLDRLAGYPPTERTQA
jgi:hypothetical protein